MFSGGIKWEHLQKMGEHLNFLFQYLYSKYKESRNTDNKKKPAEDWKRKRKYKNNVDIWIVCMWICGYVSFIVVVAGMYNYLLLYGTHGTHL